MQISLRKLWGEWKCSESRLWWWWFYNCVNVLKINEMYTHSRWVLCNVNYSSMKLVFCFSCVFFKRNSQEFPIPVVHKQRVNELLSGMLEWKSPRPLYLTSLSNAQLVAVWSKVLVYTFLWLFPVAIHMVIKEKTFVTTLPTISLANIE